MEGSKSKVFTYVILVLVIVVIGSILIFASVENTSKNQVTTTVQATTTIVQNSSQMIIPGTFPTPSCVAPIYQVYSNIVNITGLSLFNVSGTKDYVIEPGNAGKMRYIIYVGNTTFVVPQNQSLKSSKLSITNVAQLYHAASKSNQTHNTTPEIEWTWSSNVPSYYGIRISYDPANEVLMYNSSSTINVSISVESNALVGTYWISLSPGPCLNGPIALLTIGKNPFNGSVNGNANVGPP